MNSFIPSSFYFEESVYKKEQQHLFKKLWIFAGFKSAIRHGDGYLTKKIAGIPVVVVNTGDGIRAFVNQCLHRQMPLVAEDFGVGRLACKYHGWTYECNGRLRSIPRNDELYLFSDELINSMQLREFKVELLGNLVFVNLDPNPLKIEEQFSPEIIAKLEKTQGCFSDSFIFTKIPCKYNWKLNFENVIDFNHIPFVHPKTFKPLLQEQKSSKSIPPISESLFDNTRLLDASRWTTTPIEIKHWPWHEQVARYIPDGVSNNYYNFFLYPNLNFISVGGLIFLAQEFNPVTPSSTEVVFTLSTAVANERLPELPAILWEHLKAEMKVFEEDRILLEALQSGLTDESKSAFHGAYEVELQKVKKIYLDLIGAAS